MLREWLTVACTTSNLSFKVFVLFVGPTCLRSHLASSSSLSLGRSSVARWILHHFQPLALRLMGNRLNRSITSRSGTNKVRCSHRRLFYQVSRSRATCNCDKSQGHELHLDQHRLILWHSRHSNHWQWEAISQPRFDDFCAKLNIRHVSSFLVHPQANGQVKAVRKIIKHGLNLKLKDCKGK